MDGGALCWWLVAVLAAGIFTMRLHRSSRGISVGAWSVFTAVLAYAFLLDSGRIHGYSDLSLLGTLLAVWLLARLLTTLWRRRSGD